MVLHLTCTNHEELERHLFRLITLETTHWREKITYVDCQNTLSPYSFPREALQCVMNQLYFTRIDRAYDLLDLLKNISRNELVKSSHYLVIAPYSHLLEDFIPSEKKNWQRMFDKSLERVEQTLPLHVILLDLAQTAITSPHLHNQSLVSSPSPLHGTHDTSETASHL